MNLSGWETLRGSPLYSRIGACGRRCGRYSAPTSPAGSRAVGTDITGFAVGDEVYGDNLWLEGGFAECAVAPASALAHKPDALPFVEASTIPQAGPIAWQGTAAAGPGGRVLINGAGGGSGSFAIQLAKRRREVPGRRVEHGVLAPPAGTHRTDLAHLHRLRLFGPDRDAERRVLAQLHGGLGLRREPARNGR